MEVKGETGKGWVLCVSDVRECVNQLMLKVARSAHLAVSGEESEPKQIPFLVNEPLTGEGRRLTNKREDTERWRRRIRREKRGRREAGKGDPEGYEEG